MAQRRMAGGQGFQQGMNRAAAGPQHQEKDNYKAQGSHLIGGGAWDRQVARESQTYNNAAVSGSRNAENIAAYANASKQATASNGNFSADQYNKWTNSARDQSNTSKQQEAASNFSGNRVTNNVNYSNAKRNQNLASNEGVSMNVTQNFVNNAKNSREQNTQMATQFANNTTQKYLAMNKGNQAADIGKLDQAVRSSSMRDQAKSQIQGLNTYGDMYRYGRESLPQWNSSQAGKPVQTPDFSKMYKNISGDIKDIKI